MGLVIIGPNGETISTDGRQAISTDPEGHEFPWYPKPVADLKNGPGALQESPSVIYFCEGSDGAEQQRALELMKPLAETYVDRQKHEGTEDPVCAFLIATQATELSERLRDLMELPKDVSAPRLVLVDIPDDGAF